MAYLWTDAAETGNDLFRGLLFSGFVWVASAPSICVMADIEIEKSKCSTCAEGSKAVHRFGIFVQYV